MSAPRYGWDAGHELRRSTENQEIYEAEMLYLSKDEKEAIYAVDENELRNLTQEAPFNGNTARDPNLLYRCGPYIATACTNFNKAVLSYNRAKSGKKLDQTRQDVIRAGRKLLDAVRDMKERATSEDSESELFLVYDSISPPIFPRNPLEVRVSFKWRKSSEDDWSHGSITFKHRLVVRPDLALHAPKRKPSAAQKAREFEEKLEREWSDLYQLAVRTVHDFFKRGGDGNTVPESFEAVTDSRYGSLNNFSLDFWGCRG